MLFVCTGIPALGSLRGEFADRPGLPRDSYDVDDARLTMLLIMQPGCLMTFSGKQEKDQRVRVCIIYYLSTWDPDLETLYIPDTGIWSDDDAVPGCLLSSH